jgi:ABC-2 type transport system ATP-binding protein
MEPVVSVKKLSKSFGKVEALQNVSFDIKAGAIVGFLGPNGAGKSTTINTLLGFLHATSGSATIFGHDVNVGAINTRRDIGFLSNSMSLDKTLTVEQELKYFGNLAGKYNPKRTHELAKQLSLSLTAKIGDLSTGNYQKVGLVIALMNQPKLLILDEPTNGLDPLVQAEFNKIILDMRDNGTTIFISSHILSEVQELCDEFIFIRDGKIAAQLTREQLAKKTSESITIDLAHLDPAEQKNVKLLLTKHKIKFQISTGDLNETFMQFYENGDRNA